MGNIEEKAPEGSVLDGIVKRLTSFGAFVEVFPGVEGLVHISQIAHEHIATPAEKLTEGEEIKVKVLSVNPEEHRLSLSIKALEEKPAELEAEEQTKHESTAKESRQRPRREKSQRPRRQSNQATSNEEIESGFTLGDMISGGALEGLSFGEDEE